jgi:putative tryptophan/tyrosine transport system substrate-binding protein
VRRRDVIGAFCSAISMWPFMAAAQLSGRTYRIGVLSPFSVPPEFVDELNHDGLVEGRNLVIDQRGIGVPPTRLEGVADELVKTSPDAIVTYGPAAGHAAQLATKSIPIVAYADDPVASKLVASMSQPGGNTTGVGIFAAQLDAKRLEILHELIPSVKLIGVLADPTQEGQAEVEATGRELGLELITQQVRSTDEIVPAIDALAAARVAAINVLATATFWAGRSLILDRTRTLRLPTIYFWRWFAQQGGLVSFGPNQDEAPRLTAKQLVRILNGADPGKLPILQPTKFEFSINIKTAKALGLTIPQSILLRADEVIE